MAETQTGDRDQPGRGNEMNAAGTGDGCGGGEMRDEPQPPPQPPPSIAAASTDPGVAGDGN